MIEYHQISNDIKIAEILKGYTVIASPEAMLDLIAEAGYQNSSAVIMHRETLHSDFFDLKTRLAGEILQKFSNYRMKLAIIGDFSDLKSKSLQDFIRESNRTGIINFVDSVDEAISKFNR